LAVGSNRHARQRQVADLSSPPRACDCEALVAVLDPDVALPVGRPAGHGGRADTK